MSLTELTQEEFLYFSSKIKELAGINMKDSKLDLIASRLKNKVISLGLKSYKEYQNLLENEPCDSAEINAFINLLTTNKTDFFREIKHFHFIEEEIIPKFLTGNNYHFKIWSAASSTGEEAYSLSMFLDSLILDKKSYSIVGSDIDSNVLSHAMNAVYKMEALNDIPNEFHHYLDLGKDKANGYFRIKPKIKEKVDFFKHNLIEDTLVDEEGFDLILCRNVFIYFDKETIDFIQNKLYKHLKKGGYLFIGHSESLQGIDHSYKMIAPSIFQKTK